MIHVPALMYRLPAIMVVAALTLATPAIAADTAAPAPATKPMKIDGEKNRKMHHKKGGMMSPEDLDKIEGMSAEERQNFFKEKRAGWEKMTEEQRAAAKADMKAKFDAMTPEQKEALKERQKKIGEKMRAEYQKKMDSMTDEEKAAYLEKIKSRKDRMEKDFERMTPEQQGKFKERLERKRGQMQQDRVSPME